MAARILADGRLGSGAVIAYRAGDRGAEVTRVRCVNQSATPQTVVCKLASSTPREFGRAALAQYESVEFVEGAPIGLDARQAIVLQATDADAVDFHVHGVEP